LSTKLLYGSKQVLFEIFIPLFTHYSNHHFLFKILKKEMDYIIDVDNLALSDNLTSETTYTSCIIRNFPNK